MHVGRAATCGALAVLLAVAALVYRTEPDTRLIAVRGELRAGWLDDVLHHCGYGAALYAELHWLDAACWEAHSALYVRHLCCICAALGGAGGAAAQLPLLACCDACL